jgi:hypothetical protein
MNRTKKPIEKCLNCGIKAAVDYTNAIGGTSRICSACDMIMTIDRPRDLSADMESVTETHVLAQVSE